MGVSREEEFEHQHKGNSKIHHLSPSAHGIEGPNGRYIYMRMRMFVRGNTNNFQRGFSQHAPPAILNYLKKKKKKEILFYFISFQTESCLWSVWGATRPNTWPWEACCHAWEPGIYKDKRSKRQNVATSQHGSSVGVQGVKCWILTREERRLPGGGDIQTKLWRIHRVLPKK